MKIILTAVDQSLYAAWKAHCGDLPDVEIYKGSILDLTVDAVVSPANSFGFMDGGVDLLYLQRFGARVQNHLQQSIARDHRGELLVGQAQGVVTKDTEIPWLIAAPTMRVPMILPSDTVNPFLAARAALLYALENVDSIAFPGMGTGIGRVSPAICARQMRAAIIEVRGGITFPASWLDASNRHQKLYGSTTRNLQNLE